MSKFVTFLCFGLGPNIMLLWWAKRDICMQAAQTTFFIIFKISPAYASWRVTLLLVLFCHVQNSLSCSLHCCSYIFALVMCTCRNISGWSDINTKICEQCGMAVTKWLWIGIRMCWCFRGINKRWQDNVYMILNVQSTSWDWTCMYEMQETKKWNKTLR